MNAEKSESMEKYYVALVDDEERIHDFIVEVLDQAGILEKHASFLEPVGFVEFLKTAEEEPDLVLLDVHFENSGLSGVDIIPFIREDYPFLPIILLTGMDSDAVSQAQEYQAVYFIPKPVSPDHLVRMIKFYLGKEKKSSELVRKLAAELEEHKEYQKLLEEEIETLSGESEQPEEEKVPDRKEAKAFERVHEILSSLLQQSEIMPSFVKDLEQIFTNQFGLFKKVIEILVRFDVMDSATPGLNIHKHKGTEHVYSARLSRKVRLFYYKAPHLAKRRLLRLDWVHDTKGMDKWLKSNYPSYSD